MVKYIFKIRNDGLYLLDVNITDRMLRTAGKMLSRIPYLFNNNFSEFAEVSSVYFHYEIIFTKEWMNFNNIINLEYVLHHVMGLDLCPYVYTGLLVFFFRNIPEASIIFPLIPNLSNIFWTLSLAAIMKT